MRNIYVLLFTLIFNQQTIGAEIEIKSTDFFSTPHILDKDIYSETVQFSSISELIIAIKSLEDNGPVICLIDVSSVPEQAKEEIQEKHLFYTLTSLNKSFQINNISAINYRENDEYSKELYHFNNCVITFEQQGTICIPSCENSNIPVAAFLKGHRIKYSTVFMITSIKEHSSFVNEQLDIIKRFLADEFYERKIIFANIAQLKPSNFTGTTFFKPYDGNIFEMEI